MTSRRLLAGRYGEDSGKSGADEDADAHAASARQGVDAAERTHREHAAAADGGAGRRGH